MKAIFLGAANPETGRMINAVKRVTPDFEAFGFLDNDANKKGSTFLGLPVLGGLDILDNFLKDDFHFINLITSNTETRYKTSVYMRQKGCKFFNFIHPSVNLEMTFLGTGNYIQEGVVLQADVEIGNNSSIHMGSLIGHESKIGHSVFIAHACSVSGCVTIGDGTFIGTNATLIPRLKIGRWTTIGAGSVVIKDVPDYATVVGNPARIVKQGPNTHFSGDIFDN